MSAKFTPGPWGLRIDAGPEGFPLYCEVGTKSATIARLSASEGTEDQCEPNARLIAAAPDLYEALADAKATLEEAAKLLVERYPSVANNIVNQCAIRCGDALAKAAT